jgi:PAS domain-containing protein
VDDPGRDIGDPDVLRARLAAIVDSSDDAIVSKTLDGIITSWNRGAERLYGYAAAEAVGQHIFLIIPPDRRSEEEEVLARLRSGEKIDGLVAGKTRVDAPTAATLTARETEALRLVAIGHGTTELQRGWTSASRRSSCTKATPCGSRG